MGSRLVPTAGRYLVARPTPCMHSCEKPTPSTVFHRFHPFLPGWEVRVCPECRRSSAYRSSEFPEDPCRAW